MTEPASSTAGGVVLWKLLGGATGFGIAAGLAAVVVMLMTPPRSKREWAVGLITTVIGSLCGGAAVVQYLGLHGWFQTYVGMVAAMGLAFACGLPAWAIVRWVFTWIIRRQDKDIGEVIGDARKVLP